MSYSTVAIKYANDLIRKCEEKDMLIEYGIMEVGVFEHPKLWDSYQSFRLDCHKLTSYL